MNKLKLCLLGLCIGMLLFAQGSGTLSGTITDASGSPVPGALIIITKTSSGEIRRVVGSPTGTFSVAGLAPGEYRVEIDANGVRRPGRQSIQIPADGTSQIEVTFRDVAVTTTTTTQGVGEVEIRAIAPTIQTDSAETARSYGTHAIRSLPVIDRQHEELVGLMSGVTPPVTTGDRVEDPQRNRQFNVNGQPDFANVHHQDGAYNNEAYSALVMRVAPNESMEAMNIRTSNYNAEYGFSAGSWTNAITRPGNKGVHGSLFAFNTNNFFTARHPFQPDGVPTPRFTQNQFGGTIGAAVVPDRLFWFVSYDGLLRRGRELSFSTVPTAAMRAGTFTAFPDLRLYNPVTGNANTGVGRALFPTNTIPSAQISATARALLLVLPTPNQPGLINNLAGGSMLEEDNHRFDTKVDHRFSDRTHGLLRYGFTQADVERGSLISPLGDAASAGLRNHNAVASVSHNFGVTMLGEFRLGYSRYRNQIAPGIDPTGLTDSLVPLGFASGIPQFTISGFGTFGTPNYSPKSVNNTYIASTNWLWHTGMHKLKFGADLHHILADGFATGAFSSLGTFLFSPGATASPAGTLTQMDVAANSFAAFLLGAPSQAGITNFVGQPGFRQTQWAAYLTDTVRLWDKLYLELGVRYDLYSPLRPRDLGGAGMFDPVTNLFRRFGDGDLDEVGNQRYDTDNIAPRVGFAFSPMDRVAIRGGYGFHYFPTPFALSSLNLTTRGFQQGVGAFGVVPFRIPTIPAVVGETALNQPLFVSNPDGDKTPYVQSYSFTIQADAGSGILAEVGYVGAMGRHMPFNRILAADPGRGLAGLPFFTSSGRTALTTERGVGLNNNYNSAQVNITKRFASSIAFSAAYTFSRAMDYGYQLANPFDLQSNYGPADWDRKHNLAISHLWRLPYGASTGWAQLLANWELNGMLRWATGAPYTVTADPLFCGCPGVQAVPAVFSGTSSDFENGNFDPARFATPGFNTFGNLSRNVFRGPDMFNYNLALFRGFNFSENTKLELRAEAYNLTNSTNLANPATGLGIAGAGRSLRTFGGIGGRQFQVAIRLLY